MTQLKMAIKKIAESNQEGFTVKIPDLDFVVKGISVAHFETQNCFGDEGLEKVLQHALNHDKVVGGWLNRKNRKYYFDSIKIFDNLDEAKRFGIENKQIAIFDLNSQMVIEL